MYGERVYIVLGMFNYAQVCARAFHLFGLIWKKRRQRYCSFDGITTAENNAFVCLTVSALDVCFYLHFFSFLRLFLFSLCFSVSLSLICVLFEFIAAVDVEAVIVVVFVVLISNIFKYLLFIIVYTLFDWLLFHYFLLRHVAAAFPFLCSLFLCLFCLNF